MEFLFAWRYFKGKKSTQAIQIISWVSVFAMMVGTAAIIIVLSVFNGFESFIKDLYSNFYPPIKITTAIGKTFALDSTFLYQLKSIPNVKSVSCCLEEKVMLGFEENQIVATLKGVDVNYKTVAQIDKKLVGGEYLISADESMPSLLLGAGLSNRLGANEQTHIPLKAYSFKNDFSSSVLNPAENYQSQLFAVAGVYMLQDDIDNKYAIASLPLVQNLSAKSNQISSIEISIAEHVDMELCQQKIQAILPRSQHLKVETRFEQNRTLNFILSSERWFVFAFLVFILFIASFNIIGALSMLVIDKEKDIKILKAMGMQHNIIQKIFLKTGILLSMIGGTLGCSIAYVVCFVQQQFGIVKLGDSGSFLVEAYPVKMQVTDFVVVFVVVFVISIFASIIPAIKAGKRRVGFMMK
jgi:lipoprotein-releasing system permease protein